MGTISATLPTLGGPRGDGEAAVRNALAALIAEFNGNIDAANLKNAPLVLLNTLTAKDKLVASGATFGAVEVFHSGAPSGQRRADLVTVNGVTTLVSASDDDSVTLKTGLAMDHVTGNVSFPSQMKKSIIPAPESRTNAAYGTLPTPDQVTVTLPPDGLLKILFQATWQDSVSGQGRAAIFIGANQLTTYDDSGPTLGPNEAFGGVAARDVLLFTSPQVGLVSGGSAYPGEVTTGQMVGGRVSGANEGGPIYVFAAAGTYTISVQFKSASGSVTVKNRKLWVGVEPYS